MFLKCISGFQFLLHLWGSCWGSHPRWQGRFLRENDGVERRREKKKNLVFVLQGLLARPAVISDPVLMPFSGSTCGDDIGGGYDPPARAAPQPPAEGRDPVQTALHPHGGLGWDAQRRPWAGLMLQLPVAPLRRRPSRSVYWIQPARGSQPQTQQWLPLPLWSLTSPSSLPEGPCLI